MRPTNLWQSPVALALAMTAIWSYSNGAAIAVEIPKKIGQEIAIGRNLTDEDCRLRLMRQKEGKRWWQFYQVFCGEWGQPTGDFARSKCPSGDFAIRMNRLAGMAS